MALGMPSLVWSPFCPLASNMQHRLQGFFTRLLSKESGNIYRQQLMNVQQKAEAQTTAYNPILGPCLAGRCLNNLYNWLLHANIHTVCCGKPMRVQLWSSMAFRWEICRWEYAAHITWPNLRANQRYELMHRARSPTLKNLKVDFWHT